MVTEEADKQLENIPPHPPQAVEGVAMGPVLSVVEFC